MTNFIPALPRLAGCCVFGLVVACGQEKAPAPDVTPPNAPVSAVPAKTLRIDMTDQMTYAPIHPTIAVGDTVEWVNVGAMPHTATDFPGATAVAVNQVLPDGATPFDTESVMGGETSRIVFTTPGEYTYLCIFHEGMKMVGRLTVK